MRIAFISDIHANLPALEAVLDALNDLEFDELVCLGDTVGYAAHPAECLERVRRETELVLLGNHDYAVAADDYTSFNPHAAAGASYARQQLDEEALAYLRSLESSSKKNGIRFTHASPRDPLWEYVFPDTPPEELSAIAAAAEAATCVMGHTHMPMSLNVRGVRLLNPGSVGQPRDGDPRASFALFDTEGEFQVHRVDYDIAAAVKAVEAAGLPGFNGKRLLAGI